VGARVFRFFFCFSLPDRIRNRLFRVFRRQKRAKMGAKKGKGKKNRKKIEKKFVFGLKNGGDRVN